MTFPVESLNNAVKVSNACLAPNPISAAGVEVARYGTFVIDLAWAETVTHGCLWRLALVVKQLPLDTRFTLYYAKKLQNEFLQRRTAWKG
jgi:hypothetical protein